MTQKREWDDHYAISLHMNRGEARALIEFLSAHATSRRISKLRSRLLEKLRDDLNPGCTQCSIGHGC